MVVPEYHFLACLPHHDLEISAAVIMVWDVSSKL